MSSREELDRRRGQLSPEKQALLGAQLRKALTASAEKQQIPRLPNRTGVPLSLVQEGLWFLQQLEPGSTAYNRPTHLRLTGPLNAAALEQSLNEIVRRHEALRTCFPSVAGRPFQQIEPERTLTLPFIDLSALPPAEAEAEARRTAVEEARRPFDPGKGPLVQARLIRLQAQEHILLLTIHHIVFDGWSQSVLQRELAALYEAFCAGRPSPLPPLPLQYADHAVWQRERLQGSQLQSELAYWRRELAGAPPALELPTDRPRPSVQTFHGGHCLAEIPGPIASGLSALSQRQGATLFMTLLAAFQTLLARWTGQPDVVVGVPVAGRSCLEVEELIGLFVNLLPLRTDLGDDPSFSELLRRVRATALGAFAHQEAPFEQLVDALRLPRDPSRNPLVQVLLNVPNYPKEAVRLANGLTIAELPLPEHEARFDLTLYARETARGIALTASYNADLYDAARVQELLEQYKHLLEQVVRDPEERIGRYSLVTPAAGRVLPNPCQALPAEWCGSIPARFAHHARREPSRAALVSEEGIWTYGELESQSNRLAHYLRARGVSSQDVVAVHSPRCAGLAWAVLGILKAGAAFLLLDPAHPEEWRLERIRAVRPCGWIRLRSEGETTSLDVPPCRAAIDLPARAVAPGADLFGDQSADDLPGAVKPDDVAYLAFTSGTTGKPKAVVGTHRPLSHFLNWHATTFGMDASDRFALLSGLGHDPLLRDLFTPWWLGATLCIPSVQASSSDVLAVWLREQNVSVLHLAPSQARLLCQAAAGVSWPGMRYVFFAGEPLRWSDVARLRGRAPGAKCVNFYGTTETPQAMSCQTAPDDFPGNLPNSGEEKLPLGRGIDGVQLLVLTKSGQPAGRSEVGEIHVRTPYLSRGYLNDEALTRERFLVNPFTREPEDRLYRTGDRGRYLPDGTVEFLGRQDTQVKIRGFRVELEEIEAVLGRHPRVREAVVLARGDLSVEGRLTAYVVPRDGEAPAVHELRDYLRQKLPDYMTPAAFVVLDQLPLTPNGKVDRRALPAPTEGARPMDQTYTAPRTPAEETLAAIWTGLLKLNQVGVHDNFFDLGGHSLLAAQLVARMREKFSVEIPLRAIFETPTVEKLALVLLEQQARAADPTGIEALLAELESMPDERAESQLLAAGEAGPTIPAAASGFHCPRTKSEWFGRRKCNLVIVLNENFEAADFERVASYVREFDPEVEAVVVRDHPSTNLSLAARPTLIFSPALLRHRPTPYGRVFCGCPLSKSEEYAALEKAAIPVPRWVLLTQHTALDLSGFDDYVVCKPDYGGRGAEVNIVRKNRVRWKPITTRLAGTSAATIVQQFIYTGRRPVSYRVNTLFGKVLYAVRHEASGDRGELTGPDDFRSGVRQGGVSIVASARGSRVEPSDDEAVIRLGESAHAAFPDLPLLGFDVIRETNSGKLYVLEANAIGYVWNFTASQPADYGFSFEEQFDGVRKAAYVLAEKTQQYAR